MINKHQTIAIVIGSDNSGTLGVIRSLGEVGVPMYAIIISDNTSFVKHSRYIEKSWVVNEEEENIVNILISEIKPNAEKSVIIPTSDFAAKTIDKNIDVLKNAFLFPNINMKSCEISRLMNKSYMIAEAKKAGLSTPASKIIELRNIDIEIQLQDICFPCIVKPTDSVSGSKDYIKKCTNKEVLLDYLFSLKEESMLQAVVIQEYVTGNNNFMIDLMGLSSTRGDIYLPGFFKKIRQYANIKQSSLEDGNCSLALLTPETFNQDMLIVKKFIQALGFKGLFDIEFKVVDGKPIFIEINFRIGGTNYMYTKAGVNLPYLWYLDACGEEVSHMLNPIEKETIGIMEQRDIRNVFSRNISIFTYIRDVFKADSREIFNSKDFIPFFAFILSVPKKMRANYLSR